MYAFRSKCQVADFQNDNGNLQNNSKLELQHSTHVDINSYNDNMLIIFWIPIVLSILQVPLLNTVIVLVSHATVSEIYYGVCDAMNILKSPSFHMLKLDVLSDRIFYREAVTRKQCHVLVCKAMLLAQLMVIET